jgi:hypothetical protein
MGTRWIGLIAMGVALATAGARAQECDDFDPCTVNDMCVDEGFGSFCMGTLGGQGSCDDGDECTVNDRCDAVEGCTGDPAPVGTQCQGGCGTCQSLSPIPIPGLPLTCTGDVADNGMACDAGALGPCLDGTCQITQTVPGFPAFAFCFPRQKECPDAGNCRGACNFETGRCDNSLSRCFGECERCEQGQCVPANQGRACDDFNPCSTQSACTMGGIDGELRGYCFPGAPTGDTPTPTATGQVSTPTLPPTATRTPATPPTPGPCVGDCSQDGTVAINELVIGVNIALGNAQVGSCPSFDTNGDQSVAVNELIGGVNALLNGCAA